MATDRKNVGQLGEEAAARFLKKNGYKILDRNFQNNSGRKLGEIDIVAFDEVESTIVFVEVKTREFKKYEDTLPEENITYPKLRKLARIANVYLKQKKLEDSDFRFDAVSVWLDDNGVAKIKHIPGL